MKLAAPKGLSSVPQPAASSGAFEVDAPAAPLAPPVLAFPGTEMVAAAAALFQSRPPWGATTPPLADRHLTDAAPRLRRLPGGGLEVDERFRLSADVLGLEGRRFSVTLSPGTFTVSTCDPAVLERNALNALGHETRGTREVYAPAPDEYDGVSYANDDGDSVWREPIPARQVEGWSKRSRARMTRRLAQLDWAPMYAAGRSAVMVTVTLPNLWLEVAPTGSVFKEQLDALMKRWGRRWHECNERCAWVPYKGRKRPAVVKGRRNVCCVPCRTLRAGCTCGPSTMVRWERRHHYRRPAHSWKLEFQRRGAPHAHLMVVPPRDPAFRDWLSTAWAEVVGADWCGSSCWASGACCERGRHKLAGTGVDHLRGGRVFDPKRAAVYFSKHGGAAGGKEYQHVVPEAWQAPGAGPGRFWGYRGLEPATVEVEVGRSEYFALRRTLRRWSKAQGLTRTVAVPRGPGFDAATGEVLRRQRRRVTRRRGYLTQGGMQGGTVIVNDGPAFASALARLIE